MTYLLRRLRRVMWTWKQPLTRQPSERTAPISDLFVWRASNEWQTYFELLDTPSLFADYSNVERYVTIIFFDHNGLYCLEKRMCLLPHQRQTLNVSSLIGDKHGAIGTFAVFHSPIPGVVTDIDAHLAERGYVSYRYQKAPLQAYVHGNFDAIARRGDQTLQLLGTTGWLSREYCLQHAMEGAALYQLGIVNPTDSAQSFDCQLISLISGKVLRHQKIKSPSKGIHLISFQINESEPARAVIRSRLIMARPIVFRIQNSKLDVFHG